MLDLTWYTTLEKPALTPPVWVFAPAWIFLYITIFAALLLFTVTRTRKSKIMGYTYFILQVILNILWTPSFFILNNPALALIDIIALDIFVLLNIIEFYKISKFSGLLLIPYLLWLLFATYLNAGILILNKKSRFSTALFYILTSTHITYVRNPEFGYLRMMTLSAP